MKRVLAAAVAAIAVAAPTSLLAWGGSGHRFVGVAAMRALPAELPAFLRTPKAAVDVGELSREPDRIKRAGDLADSDREPGHFIDYGEDGKVLDGPPMVPLAASRQAFEDQLRPFGLDQWKTGYLPYSIIDRWQLLSIELAYWRVLTAAEANPAWKAHHDWFKADRIRREALILEDIGALSHFVGDGSQPLHVSKHFNGWGDYPNPEGYTNAKIHSPFEGALVRANVTLDQVSAAMAPLKVSDAPIGQQVGDYLTTTGEQVIPLYQLEKQGGLAAGDPRGPAFAVKRLGAGASELRDLIVEAWRDSAGRSVGWKPVPVQDVLAGKVDPYDALYSVD